MVAGSIATTPALIEELKLQLSQLRERTEQSEMERDRLACATQWYRVPFCEHFCACRILTQHRQTLLETESIQHRTNSTMHDISAAQLEKDELLRQCRLKEQQILDLQSSERTQRAEITRLQQTISHLEQQLAVRRDENVELQSQVKSLQDGYERATAEQTLSVRRLEDTDNQKGDMQREFQKLNVELNGTRERCEALHKELQQRAVSFTALQKEKAQLDDDRQRLIRELEKSRVQTQALHEEVGLSQHCLSN